MPRFTTLAFALLLVFSSGCATIVQGSSQDIPVDTTPSGAIVTVDGIEMGQTPTVLNLKRGETHEILLELDGYRTATLRLQKDLDFVPAVVGNIFSWGLLGFAVDFVSGAAYELSPEMLQATLDAEGMSVVPSDDPDQIRVVLLPVEAVEAAMAGE